LVPGVEIHTQTFESMLTNNLLSRSVFLDRVEEAMVLIAGLIVIFALPYRSPLVASAAYAGVVLTLIGCAIGSFHQHLLIDAVYPVTASAVVFLVMVAANLRATESARRILAGTQARLEGEIDAASSIQMGLLPKPLTPAESRAVDVWALIEPARTVGGDLYDFLLIDSRRLAFAIADVSGKGVPAALFMAMTKEVLRDATLRNADALDRAFMEANTKISATSVDVLGQGGNMMFVTVFAGVLDLVSGMLAYVNAGHDDPFLLRPGVETRQMTGQGGPPLGTVDDFPYPVEHRQLAPGEIVLLYTDGVTEAQDKTRSFYEMGRLWKLLASATPPDAKSAVELVREDVNRFVAGAEQADDITLLAVRWLGPDALAS
jgi:serine phosphatase RsbU (regulator of sigma subunit)